MKHRVSVIIPTYNRAALIGETIESLLAQTRRPDEILVIDDGSTDETPAVLARHDVTAVRTENRGKANALNLGLTLISGDLVWIVDDDDILLPEACAVLAAPLEADPDLGFCAGRHIDFEVDPRSGERVTRPPGYMRGSAPGQIFPDLLEGCHVFQPGLMVRRSVYASVGPFDTNLVRSQDYEMILRIARRHRGVQLEDVVFHHREHRGRRGTAAQGFAAHENASRWAEYNRRIFGRLLPELRDEEVLAEADRAALEAAIRPRAARIKRGVVMARQRMWPEAVAAWQEAAAMDPSPLAPVERDMLTRSPNSTLGAPELFADAGVRTGLRDLSQMGAPGREMARIVRRAARWHLRAAVRARDWPRLGQGICLMLGR